MPARELENKVTGAFSVVNGNFVKDCEILLFSCNIGDYVMPVIFEAHVIGVVIRGRRIVKRCIRTGVGMVFAALLAFPSALPALAAPSDADVARAREAQNQTQMSLSAIELRLSNLSAESDRLAAEAIEAQQAAKQAQAAVFTSFEEANGAQERADAAKGNVDQARASMATAARAMYQDSAANISSAYYVFDSDSLERASSRNRAYQHVLQQTDQQVREYSALESLANTLQKQADAQLEQSKKLAEEADKAEQEAQAAAAAAATQVQEAADERERLSVQLAQAKNTTVELERQRLAALEADRQARIAEQIAAQQAEAARQEAARAAAAQQAGSSRQVSPNIVTPAPQAPASSGSGMGDQIAAFAKRYTGHAYVWGGTSPTTGWDCSGFVQYVYRNFGINIPRVADAQGNAGRTVSAAEARPGDIVWWPGQHVAIYIGNGQIVGAQNPQVGTIITNLYGYYVFVRYVD